MINQVLHTGWHGDFWHVSSMDLSWDFSVWGLHGWAFCSYSRTFPRSKNMKVSWICIAHRCTSAHARLFILFISSLAQYAAPHAQWQLGWNQNRIKDGWRHHAHNFLRSCQIQEEVFAQLRLLYPFLNQSPIHPRWDGGGLSLGMVMGEGLIAWSHGQTSEAVYVHKLLNMQSEALWTDIK